MADIDQDNTEEDEYLIHLVNEFNTKLANVEAVETPLQLVIGNSTVELDVPEEDKNKWEWTVYCRPSNDALVRSVKFMLHPTFQPPYILQMQPPFEVTRRGWGTFEITVHVTLMNDEVHQFKHTLSFQAVSERTVTVNSSQQHEYPRMENVAYLHMHGQRAGQNWHAPFRVVTCDTDARPGYNTMKAHEYDEDPRTLREKIRVMAQMIRASQHTLAYTGAGISTASGIDDYASKAKDSKMYQGRKKVRNAFEAEPTLGHRVLTHLWRAGHLQHWVQQNHDGLPQKAGFPQHEINEIHGAWYDPSNPVVPMSGTLRSDLCDWMYKECKKTDLCIAMGTSLCGMNADRCVQTPARKYKEHNWGYGAVIVGLQRTQYDDICSLRIFARIDEVVALLARELNLTIPGPTVYVPDIPPDRIHGPDQFIVPYDTDGNLSNDVRTIWDLRDGQKMIVNGGPGDGFKGKMKEKSNGHYRICTNLIREGDPSHGKGFCNYVLGNWWVETAVKGLWPTIPIKNIDPVIV